MNYLFFDIECCDGQHICEFGYLLVDENFEILQRECITVNPEQPFKLSGRDKEGDIRLAFSEEQYYSSPKFPEVYPKIKAIVEGAEQRIIGFAMQNDKRFLKIACERYALPFLSFDYLDLQKLYKAYSKGRNYVSLSKMLTELEVNEVAPHKSDDDSFAAMRALQTICAREGVSLCNGLSLLLARQKERQGAKRLEKRETRGATIGELLGR